MSFGFYGEVRTRGRTRGRTRMEDDEKREIEDEELCSHLVHTFVVRAHLTAFGHMC